MLGLVTTTSVTLGAIAAVTFPIHTSVAAPNTPRFSDIQGYWAEPFIQTLAEQNIIAGYLDGTFRPNQPMSRDEFAAIVQSAFNQADERQLASGSVYKDVPQGYWAVPAIEEAYEMGFVQAYPDGSFRPQQPVTKASALSSLAQTWRRSPLPQPPQPRCCGSRSPRSSCPSHAPLITRPIALKPQKEER
ncbi:MAG: S-layer homology domain-containing protein [Leptolyngbyaceae cyanobacterium CSU_1_4]|nr:S-layer homology domain-containing protein [Leptolyngbyaceae cyanobacterium CSU_1_4]